MTEHLTRDEIQTIVRETIAEAGTLTRSDVSEVVRDSVRETLVTLGIDASKPLTVQQDMHFVRELREASEKVKSRGLLVLTGILITAAVGAIWVGVKTGLAGS